MTQHNPIYALISSQIPSRQNQHVLFNYTVEKKTDLRGANYVLIHLPNFNCDTIIRTGADDREHQVSALHLSVFELIMQEVGYGSHYHITMQCQDPVTHVEGILAHVYFEKHHI